MDGCERLKAACTFALEKGMHRYRDAGDIPVSNRDRAATMVAAAWIYTQFQLSGEAERSSRSISF